MEEKKSEGFEGEREISKESSRALESLGLTTSLIVGQRGFFRTIKARPFSIVGDPSPVLVQKGKLNY